MSAAVGVLINQWMIPHLNAYKIRTEVLEGNLGSVRVLEKNGLKFLGMVECDLAGSGREGIERMHALECERPNTTTSARTQGV